MDNNPSAPQGNVVAEPLMENQYVQELFSVLHENGRDTTGLAALIGHVGEMESFVKRAEDTIAGMKSQLSEMKEVQNHPVKTSLQSGIKNLEQKVADIKERIGELKNNIIEGCKSAVQAFKEKGLSALDKLASFFKIKSGLHNITAKIEVVIKANDNAVNKINSFASEYHSAGRAIKNMARVAVGRQPLDAKKEAGKLAKTFAAPYKAQKAALVGMKKTIVKAVKSLETLESDIKAMKTERPSAKKPSLLGQLKENLEIVEQAKREHRVQERTANKGTEL